MTATPRLLRHGGDPIDAVRVVVARYEELARSSRERYLTSFVSPRPTGGGTGHGQSDIGTRPPLLVVAATGIDAASAEHLTDDAYMPLGDTELEWAARRAGLENFDIDGADTEQLRGVLTSVRGAVGEQWVLERLRDHQLPVPEGAVAAELLPFTTPGVDLVFTDDGGATVGTANVKIAGTADVVLRHFERHPDVAIVYATSEAATDAASRGVPVVALGNPLPEGTPVVVDIGRSARSFDEEIGATLSSADQMNHWDAIDLIPWFSVTAIGVRAALRLRAGAPRDRVATQVGRDVTAAGAALVAARIASRITNSEPTTALIAMLTSALTFGALDVRRAWTTLPDGLTAATMIAESLATTGHWPHGPTARRP